MKKYRRLRIREEDYKKPSNKTTKDV